MEHLKNAPIVEAVIEFGVVPPAGISVATLDPMRRQTEKTYGPMADLYNLTGQFTFDSQTFSAASEIEERVHVGFRTASREKGRLVTLTTTSLAFHKLRPYTSWHEVLPEAWQLWEMYREQIRPEQVRRIAARYVNRLDLPAPEKLRDYLSRVPPVDEAHLIKGYAKLLQIRDRDSGLLANLTERLSIAKKSEELRIDVTIDNDVFSEGHWPPEDDHGIRSVLDQIHDLKNKLFREAVTDRVLKFYQEDVEQ